MRSFLLQSDARRSALNCVWCLSRLLDPLSLCLCLFLVARIRLCTSVLSCEDEEPSDLLSGEDGDEVRGPTDEEDDDGWTRTWVSQ